MATAKAVDRSFEVTHKSVVLIALPMTLAFVSTPLLGLADTAVVGQFGNAALLGGLAIGAILFDLVDGSFNFLRAATTGFVAQALGAGDEKEQQAVFLRSLLIAALSGLLLLALTQPLLALALPLMGATGEVGKATRLYVEIRMFSAPLALVNYAILGWLLGLGRAGTGLAVQTVLNGLNIILSFWLGLTLGWGIEGVAWATVIAQAVALVLGLLIFWWSNRHRPLPSVSRVFNIEKIRHLFGVNRDIMIRSFCLIFAFAFFTAQSSRMGEITLASNAVLMNFFLLSGYLLDGFATAAEQLAGRAVGARYRPAFDRAVKLTLLWGFILAGIATASFLIFGPALIDLLTTNEAVRAQARDYLFWAALTALAGVAAFQMDGVYIGATWSSTMRNMMLISLVGFLLVWAIASPIMGNHGLWLALEVFLGIRGITLLARLPKLADREFSRPA